MTSEAHKRNPPGSERWGAKRKLAKPTEDEISICAVGNIGDPQLLEYVDAEGISHFYVLADEYEKWNAGRTDSQALGAQ
jgi:hypothetical protein